MPRLLAQPAERGEPVGALIERVEPPTGAERPARALDHDLKTALGDQPPEQEAECAAPVRRAHQHRGCRPTAGRGVAVGEQNDAVVHPDGKVAVDHELPRSRRGQPEKPAGNLAEQRHRRSMTGARTAAVDAAATSPVVSEGVNPGATTRTRA